MGMHVGLDIGIASVGWCVIDTEEKHIVGIGVRTFPRAENPKTGASLALPRRLARSSRRRLRRRRNRMRDFRALVLESRMLTPEDLDATFKPTGPIKTPYELRVEGLDRKLAADEWVRVLSQLCKRRGYQSNKLDTGKSDDDEGVVKKAIAENRAAMESNGYRTAGEMLLKDERFNETKRNKGGYKGVLSRDLLLEEIDALFEAQRRLGNPFATAKLQTQYMEILTRQAHIKEGEELLATVGLCTIDRKNRRIPVACRTFERFRVVDKLHNVRYTTDTQRERIGLTPRQMAAIVERAFEHPSELHYGHVRSIAGLPDSARFVGVKYGREDDGNVSAAEKKTKLPHPRSWNEIRRVLQKADPEAWEQVANSVTLSDAVAHVLTYYKYDESIVRELRALGLSEAAAQGLTELRFSKNAHLSRETLLAILPHMEGGLPYSQACAAAGFHHSQRLGAERSRKLPAIPGDELANPVVARALSQSRKVLNAIIDRYGSPEEVHIELARDIGRSYQDRRDLEKRQEKNRAKNEAVLKQLAEEYGMANPRPLDIVKFKLWKEQDGRCMYSGKPIDAHRMLSGEPGVAEVDHILPHSRSFDDSYMNKVLVTTAENRNKSERTPYEYLGGDPNAWHLFEERVLAMYLPRPKRERLLRLEFDEHAEDDFRERNLNDTRYIARYFKNFVEENLLFADDRKRPVLTLNGAATAYLRRSWQLQKVRADGDLHHALDAAVAAGTTWSMVHGVSRFHSARQLRNRDGVYFDKRTGENVDAKHVPEPWEGFIDELKALLTEPLPLDPVATRNGQREVLPILVSRMPDHGVRGQAHEETIRRVEGADPKGRTITSSRVALTNLTLKQLENMVGKEHDVALYEALRARLEAFDGNSAKAFAEPFYKPTAPGKTAPIVRGIRVYDEASSGGTLVRGGLAANGEMIRTDVFERDSKYYLVPVYVKDAVAGELPNKAIVGGKGEADWREMDESYRFAFSLYMNDPVRLVKKKGDATETFFGYFKGPNRATCSITIQAHDSSWTQPSIGVAQNVIAFEKLHIDVLGQTVSIVRREKRLGFSQRRNSE